MAELTYRAATSDDASVISALGAYVWLDTYGELGVDEDCSQYIAAAFSIDKIGQELQTGDNRALLCFDGKFLVGFAMFGKEPSQRPKLKSLIELERLYIHRSFKRRGIGKMLCKLVFDQALISGARGFWLSVYHGNHDAIAFYKRLGLEHVDDTYFTLGNEQHLNHVLIRSK